MENKSIWNKYLKEKQKVLDKDLEYDVLIIGGGISGVLTAYNLNNTNLKVALVERNTLLSGITSKMTAKVTPLQDILTKIKENELDLYLKSQIDGLKILKNNIKNSNIECDFLNSPSYLFTTKQSNIKKLKKIEEYLDQNKIKYEESILEIPGIDSKLAIKSDFYTINPIKYLNKIIDLSTNIDFYEHTNVLEVIKDKIYIVKTDKYIIKAKKLVFATNYPYFLKPLFFPIKVRLEKSYMGYGKTNLEDKSFNAINIDKEIYSLRFYKDKLLYLNPSRMIANHVNDTKCFEKMTSNKLINKYENIWSNLDLITNDYLPIVGEVFKNMYILTGYNTWGILSSHVASKMIASMILKQKKYIKYAELFRPRKRINLKKIGNSTYNIYENINGFIKGIITKNKLIFYSKDHAMYVDKDGSCYLVKRKCPHLKCNLLFNEIEKTWDCPCHGSRFDLSGNVITGPSKYDIKVD
ncbi:MAG: FAD-dependent oxidoreductase [Bacilli bacterium]|nr:FAD-dependent oxidoreductase [Bacilli bacterium]